jgi:hypothetical protein
MKKIKVRERERERERGKRNCKVMSNSKYDDIQLQTAGKCSTILLLNRFFQNNGIMKILYGRFYILIF